jgi:hypothetical protein
MNCIKKNEYCLCLKRGDSPRARIQMETHIVELKFMISNLGGKNNCRFPRMRPEDFSR